MEKETNSKKRLINLSDLHFDRIHPLVVRELPGVIEQIGPHLIIISRDLTQRARTHQFHQCQEFLKQLPCPQLVVPGNHDIPLYNLWARFHHPYRKFKRWISEDLCPRFFDGEVFVQGLNTTDPFRAQEGQISDEFMEKILDKNKDIPAEAIKIYVGHHPFDDYFLDLRVPVREQSLPDVLISGHLHHTLAWSTRKQNPSGPKSFIVLSTGTTTSTRYRGDPNAFHLIEVGTEEIDVIPYLWQGEGEGAPEGFRSQGKTQFKKDQRGWFLAEATFPI